MVNIHLRDKRVTVSPAGLHKLWCFKRKIECPLNHITDVRRAPADLSPGWWHGFRMPGTQVPGIIVAGSYYRTDGEWEFWDVTDPEKTVVIELREETYKRLVVDVADPEAVVEQLGVRASADGSV